MNNIQKAMKQVNNGFWFSLFTQSFYFSFGYFAFPKTKYDDDFLENFTMTVPV